ncbi:hypothetical protein [Thermococcus nautili]|uniref:Uncharacterized protein n=1 Tax=Thermococcus nautili TaxID=195522 RepID=W8P640_9EURY|nr:hypothetical protein [Thermococcus nautili]AHL22990.1 hypothetical protein BD01_1379 [Thermococcus nautili]
MKEVIILFRCSIIQGNRIKVKEVKVTKEYANRKCETLVKFPEGWSLNDIERCLLYTWGCYKLNGKYVGDNFYLSFDCSESYHFDFDYNECYVELIL